MEELDITRFLPRFLTRDREGYAMARAIEAGLDYLREQAEAGRATVQDPEAMPEWRLDEMAWELNALYDYGADTETKRRWIAEARPLSRTLGTPEAIYQYLQGYFDGVEVVESWQYGGDPFHFRVTMVGTITQAQEEWAKKAIARAKNVRSVMDDMAVGSGTRIVIGTETQVTGYPYYFTGEGYYAGELPEGDEEA